MMDRIGISALRADIYETLAGIAAGSRPPVAVTRGNLPQVVIVPAKPDGTIDWAKVASHEEVRRFDGAEKDGIRLVMEREGEGDREGLVRYGAVCEVEKRPPVHMTVIVRAEIAGIEAGSPVTWTTVGTSSPRHYGEIVRIGDLDEGPGRWLKIRVKDLLDVPIAQPESDGVDLDRLKAASAEAGRVLRELAPDAVAPERREVDHLDRCPVLEFTATEDPPRASRRCPRAVGPSDVCPEHGDVADEMALYRETGDVTPEWTAETGWRAAS